MKKMQQPAPTFTIDSEGRELAHVALANTDQRAVLYAEDYHRILDAGWSRYWSHTNTGGRFRQVLVNAAGPQGRPRSLTVARLVAEAPKGYRVEYIDGDRCNLRRDNLRLVKGGGICRASAAAVHPGTAEFLTGKKVDTEDTTGAPEAPTVAPVEAPAPSPSPKPHKVSTDAQRAPRAPFVPRKVDRSALSSRVASMLADGGTAGP